MKTVCLCAQSAHSKFYASPARSAAPHVVQPCEARDAEQGDAEQGGEARGVDYVHTPSNLCKAALRAGLWT
jgi:hypothetical protein